ncbi:uncharacterized protein LOC123306657 [Coccinella septempunctata]|uniref:uncharacterized protein LOC123306657 n=1 Tax=Coccinella septempunctata TaxID=41139 RepID=UPI001D08432A|nr:uncharacterized protein LOC123306657 [Coccinella septempunctata]XP_044744692.1 uncharacterized protein LOC123306657 [Coccinella septempunctata]
MAYTVVKFMEENDDEEVISEVPSSWVENGLCWWPSTKNVSNLICKRAVPDKNNGKWKQYPATILYITDDYKKARRKADDSETEAEKGRGKRRKRKSKLQTVYEPESTSGSELDEIERVLAGLPTFPSPEKDGISNETNSYMTSNLYSDEGTSVLAVGGEPDEEVNLDMTIVNVSTDQLVKDLQVYVKGEFEKTNKMLAQVLLHLERLNIGSSSASSNAPREDEELRSILSAFPIEDFETTSSIEMAIQNPGLYRKLVIYLKTIGGACLKEKINRILKRIFSVDLIAQSSWLGQSRGEKKNFRLSSLKLINAVKEAVWDDPAFNEKTFETIASEWTRQGKQRKIRSEKKNVQN